MEMLVEILASLLDAKNYEEEIKMINLCKKEDLNLLEEYQKEVVDSVNNAINILGENY